ncbi:TPA: DNA repair protein RadC [Staphylococcus aureus]|nr:DNA repair protein RadC [Staphylococcus aureus]HDF6263329.1 DNA repair protein RadC [Staphylococcus aureus]
MKPSEADLITTARLVACGRILQIEVLDHIIITSDDFISIDEIGHMPDVSPEDIFDFM